MKNEIEVVGVSKKFGEEEVLKDVNLSCEKGSITGIVGRNGSGKTVLFKCICGLLVPDKGEIYIQNHRHSDSPQLRGKIGVIIETPAFLSRYSAIKNLKILYCIQNKWDRQKVEKVLLSVGIDPRTKKMVKNYSMGMKQRLAIAQAIMEEQEILILDEPMNGLDNQGVEEIRKLLLELREREKTIILASHNSQDIEKLCDQTFEMDKGILRFK